MFAGEIDDNLRENLDVACSQTNHGVIDCVANWTSTKVIPSNPSQSTDVVSLSSSIIANLSSYEHAHVLAECRLIMYV